MCLDAGSLGKIGGGDQVPVELNSRTSYLSIFITHFFNLPTQNLAILRKLYVDQELSATQIEEISDYNWPKTTIIEVLKKNSITRKRLPSRIKFGEKFISGKCIPHKKEQKVIQKILQLRRKAMSFRAIADYLNQKGIPSKLGMNWNKTTIADIVSREEKSCKP